MEKTCRFLTRKLSKLGAFAPKMWPWWLRQKQTQTNLAMTTPDGLSLGRWHTTGSTNSKQSRKKKASKPSSSSKRTWTDGLSWASTWGRTSTSTWWSTRASLASSTLSLTICPCKIVCHVTKPGHFLTNGASTKLPFRPWAASATTRQCATHFAAFLKTSPNPKSPRKKKAMSSTSLSDQLKAQIHILKCYLFASWRP